MNKRIEHLFNEAGFHKPEMERLGIEHKFEKFAELIVGECEQVSLKNSHRNDDMGAIIAKQIKKHFGVER